MADQQAVLRSAHVDRANTVALTTAVVLLFVFTLLVVPLLAYLCHITLSTLDAEVPQGTSFILGIPFWGAVLIAAVGTAVLLAKERFFRSSRMALCANVASCLAILCAGTFSTLLLTLPIHMLMRAIG